MLVKIRTPSQEFCGSFSCLPRQRDHITINGNRYSVEDVLWECIALDGQTTHVDASPIIYLRQLVKVAG